MSTRVVITATAQIDKVHELFLKKVGKGKKSQIIRDGIDAMMARPEYEEYAKEARTDLSGTIEG